MYKKASQNLQRATAVHRIESRASLNDVLPPVAGLTLVEVNQERENLIAEKIRMEQALIIAKREPDFGQVQLLGANLQVVAARLSECKQRIREITPKTVGPLVQAIRELCPPELARQIYDRWNEIATLPDALESK